MTPELETSLSARLRALRVDPPDDGFSERFSARLEREAGPGRVERGNVTRLFGKRRGLILLSAAAVFISGGALALFEVAPLVWTAPSEPATVPAERREVETLTERPAPARVPHKERAPERVAPPPPPPPPVIEEVAPEREPAPRLPSPVGRGERRAERRNERDHARDIARPEVERLAVEPRSVPELSSPSLDREQHARDSREDRSFRIPRLNADLGRSTSETRRGERFERPDIEERARERASGDTGRRRDVERAREGARGERTGNDDGRGRRRGE